MPHTRSITCICFIMRRSRLRRISLNILRDRGDVHIWHLKCINTFPSSRSHASPSHRVVSLTVIHANGVQRSDQRQEQPTELLCLRRARLLLLTSVHLLFRPRPGSHGNTTPRTSLLPAWGRRNVTLRWRCAACGTERKQTCVNTKPCWLKNKTIIFTSGAQQI